MSESQLPATASPAGRRRLWRLLFLSLLFSAMVVAASELQRFDGVRLIPTEWADGDSFQVRFPDGSEHTVRLFGVDCFEWHVTDDTDAKRLRDQRRHFGIFSYGGGPATSIALAKSLGEAASKEVRTLLERPFTVHTSFADARGDGRYKRIYAFITTADGNDLAEVLVSRGFARAFGVWRGTPSGLSRDDYRARLQDLELIAARSGLGAWSHTDWQMLGDDRQAQRSEGEDTRIATGQAAPKRTLDINTAARDELMQIPGVGEVTANAIIEVRPFANVDDLLRVRGIGPKKLEIIRPWVQVAPGVGAE